MVTGRRGLRQGGFSSGDLVPIGIPFLAGAYNLSKLANVQSLDTVDQGLGMNWWQTPTETRRTTTPTC